MKPKNIIVYYTYDLSAIGIIQDKEDIIIKIPDSLLENNKIFYSSLKKFVQDPEYTEIDKKNVVIFLNDLWVEHGFKNQHMADHPDFLLSFYSSEIAPIIKEIPDWLFDWSLHNSHFPEALKSQDVFFIENLTTAQFKKIPTQLLEKGALPIVSRLFLSATTPDSQEKLKHFYSIKNVPFNSISHLFRNNNLDYFVEHHNFSKPYYIKEYKKIIDNNLSNYHSKTNNTNTQEITKIITRDWRDDLKELLQFNFNYTLMNFYKKNPNFIDTLSGIELFNIIISLSSVASCSKNIVALLKLQKLQPDADFYENILKKQGSNAGAIRTKTYELLLEYFFSEGMKNEAIMCVQQMKHKTRKCSPETVAIEEWIHLNSVNKTVKQKQNIIL